MQRLRDAVEAGEMTDPGGMTTTQDIADVVPDSYSTVEKKLLSLERDGYIESRTFGNDRVWFVTDDQKDSQAETTLEEPIGTATRDPTAT